jgi:hypothetical protein
MPLVQRQRQQPKETTDAVEPKLDPDHVPIRFVGGPFGGWIVNVPPGSALDRRFRTGLLLDQVRFPYGRSVQASLQWGLSEVTTVSHPWASVPGSFVIYVQRGQGVWVHAEPEKR